MKRESPLCYIFFILFLSSGIVGWSQVYPVGSSQINFTDPSRSRSIPSRVFYPAKTAGTNAVFEEGSFPLIVMGHGFAMNYQAYLNFRDTLVHRGYVLVIPTTETGPLPFPDHAEFGEDLKFLNKHIKYLNTVPGSIFYGHVKEQSAIMGHSMGGGASVLAAAGNDQLTTLVLFAPAETSPSAIEASASVSVPTIVFSGENDGVTLPDEMHFPVFNQLGTSCKFFINILGGGHCYFANSNLACDFGEGVSNPQPGITRAKQQEIVFKLLIPWMDYYLKMVSGSNSAFMNLLVANDEFNFTGQCDLSKTSSPQIREQGIYPNPTNGKVKFFLPDHLKMDGFEMQVLDLYGKEVFRKSGVNCGDEQDISLLGSGLYVIRLRDGNNIMTGKVLLSE